VKTNPGGGDEGRGRLAVVPSGPGSCRFYGRRYAAGMFWIAFVLTRPLGATGGDSLSKPRELGGLGWGTEWTSAALLAALIALITYQTIHIRSHPLGPAAAPC
jgi:Repeat of Unknown Function (DUF347)